MLGPNLKPSWVRLEGIPLHSWDAMVFHRLADCLGVVLETDEEAYRKQRVDQVRLLILRDPQLPLTATLAMDVKGSVFSSPSVRKRFREGWRRLVRQKTIIRALMQPGRHSRQFIMARFQGIWDLNFKIPPIVSLIKGKGI